MTDTALVLSHVEDELFLYKQQLAALGFDVAWCPLAIPTRDLGGVVATAAPRVIVVICSKVTETILVRLRHIMAHCCAPLLVFTADDDSRMIDEALRAGVASYVVDPDGAADRLPAIMRVADARCRLEQQRRFDLMQARQSLQERKTIDRAKGILMDRKGLSEFDAYQLLRKSAMNNNEKIVDVARRVLSVASLSAERGESARS